MSVLMLSMLYVMIMFLAWLITRQWRQYAVKQIILDIPNHRSLHTSPTPRGGGLAIVISVLMMTAVLLFTHQITVEIFAAIIGGGGIVAITGWIDDRRGMPAAWRFLLYTVAAFWACYWLLPASGSIIVLLCWFAVISWMTNLYNFMDGSDGLAASQAIYAAAGSALMMFLSGEQGGGLLLWVLAASGTGFILWNWPPARIFMGDTGSCFIGYLFGTMALLTCTQDSLPSAVWLILLAIFITDASLTLLKRFVNGEKWYAAHRSHSYQLLVQSGLSHRDLIIRVWIIFLAVLSPLAWAAFHYRQYGWHLTGLTYFIATGLWLWVQLRNGHGRNNTG